MGERACPHCHESVDPAFIAADESLVALELEMKVFNVEREEHASRIARKEIGKQLENIPLEVLSVDVIDDEDDAAAEADADTAAGDDDPIDGNDPVEGDATAPADDELDARNETDADATVERDAPTGADEPDDDEDDDVLPEFEDLID
jgi:hypothetical protein